MPAGSMTSTSGRSLRVPQLAEVEVALDPVEALRAQPAEQDVALGLHQPLALDDALAVVVGRALAEVWLEDRRLGLLRLEEQRIVAVAPEHRGRSRRGCRRCRRRRPCGPCRRTGTARGAVRRSLGERPAVRADEPLDRLLRLAAWPSATSSSIGTISGGSLTIRGSPSTRWVSFANALRLSFVRAFSTFLSMRATASGDSDDCDVLHQGVDVEAGVPDVEVAHRREALHRLAGSPSRPRG